MTRASQVVRQSIEHVNAIRFGHDIGRLVPGKHERWQDADRGQQTAPDDARNCTFVFTVNEGIAPTIASLLLAEPG